jgi:hypothetical protein
LIGAAVELFSHELLGCRVCDGTNRHVGGRQAADVINRAGYTEVGEKDSSFVIFIVGVCQHDVGWLNVAVQRPRLWA